MPELPDPPWRVYAKLLDDGFDAWWLWNQDAGYFDGLREYWDVPAEDLQVIDNPRNDREAIEIITRARMEAARLQAE